MPSLNSKSNSEHVLHVKDLSGREGASKGKQYHVNRLGPRPKVSCTMVSCKENFMCPWPGLPNVQPPLELRDPPADLHTKCRI